MINRITIHAFKSIKDLSISCTNLNLFVGTNSSGKSSVLQSLLLFQQNIKAKNGLNGPLVAIGDFREVRNNSLARDSIKIKLDGKDINGNSISEAVEFYEIESGYDTNFFLGDIPYNFDQLDDSTKRRLFKYCVFYYLSCHRIGVMDLYQRNISTITRFGNNGEYALSYLAENQDMILANNLCQEIEGYGNNLLSQVNYWLKYIVDTELSIASLPQTNYVQVKYNNNDAIHNTSSFQRPINVGSGISYLISIIIECLASEENSIIVLENPEIHLHPKAQSRLCELLYLMAASGRQLFIETHSDHIFNAIRVGISTGRWESKLITVNFLALDEQHATACNPIEFGTFGKVYGTNPEMSLDDLFDQFDIDLDRMLGL